MLFMCPARVRRCRAQCDVLVIPQLVTILSHIFLSHFCACSFSSSYSSSCCCCCCNTAYFRIFPDPYKSSKTIGAKNTVNADVFCASEAQNHGIYHDFCWYLRSFHHVARCSFFIRNGQKHCILRCVCFPSAANNRQKNV